MPKIIIFLILIAVLSAGIGFFIFQNKLLSRSTIPTPKITYTQKITLGLAVWPGDIGFYVADSKGFFKEEKLDVEVKLYPDLKQLSKDYVDQKLTGRANISIDMLSEVLDGVDQKAVSLIDYSDGADGIVALPEIKKLSDLKGKKVAFEKGTLEEYFLAYALNQNNLAISDIVSVDLNGEEAAKALEAGKVAAAVTYEPFLSSSASKLKTDPIYTSKLAPGLIADILTFRSDFVKSEPDVISAILRAYFKGLDFAKNNPDEAYKIVAEKINDTPENVASQLKGLRLGDQKTNREVFTFSAGTTSLYGNLKLAGDFVIEHNPNSSQKKLDSQSLIEPKFIREIIQRY